MSPYTAVSILSCPPAARPPEPGQAANRPKLTQGQTRVTAVPQGTPQGRLSSRVWRSPQCMPGSRWVGVPCSVPRSPAVPTQGLQPGSTELCLHPWVTLPQHPSCSTAPVLTLSAEQEPQPMSLLAPLTTHHLSSLCPYKFWGCQHILLGHPPRGQAGLTGHLQPSRHPQTHGHP